MRGPVEVVPGVYGLGSEMVNWYVVEDEGRLVAVDSGLPGFANDLEADLRSIGHSPADVEAVALTHCDGDHVGLAPRFQEAGARILIHEDDDARLRKPGPKSGDGAPQNLIPYLRHATAWRLLAHFARNGGMRPPKVEGAETYRDGDVLDVPGRPRAIHTPGHTEGHCVLYFERHGALMAGDALFLWNPLTGRLGPQVGPKAFNVSTDKALASLAAIEPLDAAVVLCGHGEAWHGSPADAVARARQAGRS